MALLEINNLCVDFATATGWFRALNNVNYHVDSGEVLAIVGESGSGKSVAMLAVMGLLPPTAKVSAECIVFNGQDLLNIKPQQRRKIIGRDMAMIFQEPIASLNPCFSVEFQINEALKTHTNLSKKARKTRCLELLNEVGIQDAASKLKSYPHQLSGGQCQRVMIAMAVACSPKLLIADEPTTALDVTVQQQILDLLVKLQQQTGMALIMITHDLGVVANVADRVTVQYGGKVMEQSTVLDLFESPSSDYTKALLAAMPDSAGGGRLRSVQNESNDL